jgi:hypothetical protein
MQVVEQHVMEVWDTGRLDVGAALQLSYVTGCKGFFERMGFEWLDPPLNEEGLKYVTPPQRGCSCGGCAGGVLSRRMNLKLRCSVDL